ncbi:tetratricopeptide repeat protein [Porphyromonas sp.]
MMRTILFACLCLCSVLGLGATEHTIDSLFTARQYREAAAALEQQIETSGESATRYANLGNCYYMLGDLGHAVLNYERAALLDPRDEAIATARMVLMKKTVDKLPDAESWFTLTGAKIAYALPLPLLLALSLVLFALVVGSCVAFALGQTSRGKRVSFYTGLVSLLLTLFVGALILHWVYATHSATEKAVIIQPEVNIYTSPSSRAGIKTQLHEGTRLRLIGAPVGEFQQFTLGDGTEGWITSEAIEPIIRR